MFSQWFAPRSVRLTLAAYASEAKKIRNLEDGVFGANAGRAVLDDELAKTVRSSKGALEKGLDVDRKSARILVLLLIANLSQRYVSSGRFHTYRGTLSMQGLGLRALWNYATTELHESGEISRDEMAAARDRLATEIKEVG